MHYEGMRQFSEAETFYVKAGLPKVVVEMYVTEDMWEPAAIAAKAYLTEQQMTEVYVARAAQREEMGELDDAGRLYVAAGQPDLAIRMYKAAQQWDNMIRVVSQHRPQFLHKTHFVVAKTLAKKRDHKRAEHHFVQSATDGSVKGWEAAVAMYRRAGLSEDADRVAIAQAEEKGRLVREQKE
eukprot:gene42803-24632_t